MNLVIWISYENVMVKIRVPGPGMSIYLNFNFKKACKCGIFEIFGELNYARHSI